MKQVAYHHFHVQHTLPYNDLEAQQAFTGSFEPFLIPEMQRHKDWFILPEAKETVKEPVPVSPLKRLVALLVPVFDIPEQTPRACYSYDILAPLGCEPHPVTEALRAHQFTILSEQPAQYGRCVYTLKQIGEKDEIDAINNALTDIPGYATQPNLITIKRTSIEESTKSGIVIYTQHGDMFGKLPMVVGMAVDAFLATQPRHVEMDYKWKFAETLEELSQDETLNRRRS